MTSETNDRSGNPLWYAARRENVYPGAMAVLMSVGCSDVVAKQYIDNASANGTQEFMVPLGDGKGVLLVPEPGGGVRLWQAMIGLATTDRGEAKQDALQLSKCDPTWVVSIFQFTPLRSLETRQ